MNLKKFQIWIFASTLILNGCSTPYQVSSDTRPVGERLKANLLFNVPMGWVKNDPAEYEISLNPDGSVKAVSKTKSSGLTGFDEAVLQAIYKSQPYPPNKTGKVPEKFILSSRPNETLSSINQRKSDEMFTLGMGLLKNARYKEAEESFYKVFTFNPGYTSAAKAHHWLGYNYYAQRKYKDAILQHQIVLAEFDKYSQLPDVMLNMANCYMELNDIDKAKTVLSELVGNYPSSSAAEMGKVILKSNRINNGYTGAASNSSLHIDPQAGQ